MDAIANIHSITVTQSQLHRCRSQLRVYLQKFRNKLKGKNRVYVAQVVRLIDSLSECIDKLASGDNSKEALVSIGDLMGGKGVDQINLSKLIRYLVDSKLARKVENYVEYVEDHEKSSLQAHTDTTSALTHVQGFLQTLMNPAAEGRFFFERMDLDTVALKYILLDPTFHFKDVVEDARAVVLAGGTMSPVSILQSSCISTAPKEADKLVDGRLCPTPLCLCGCRAIDDMELWTYHSQRKSVRRVC